jgi:hypothetical protein
MHIRDIGLEGVDWVHMAHDTDRCRAIVDVVMSLLGSMKSGEFPA